MHRFHNRAVWLLTAICISSFMMHSAAANQAAKPKLHVTEDGFPNGHDSPEGAACDLARAFIHRDDKLFSSTSIKPYGDGVARARYTEFLQKTIENIRAEATRKQPALEEPKAILKVYAARHLSKSGPASYGYASFSFQEVMFVDVSVILRNGEQIVKRTLVIKDADGNWYVHPDPMSSPLLCDGLYDESPSTKTLRDAYDLVR